MSYIKANLLAGEEVVYEGKPSVMSHWKSFLVALIFLYVAVQSGEYALLAVSVIAILLVIIACLTSEFAITNKKVMAKWGLIRRGTIDQSLGSIDGVVLDQSILGRVLNYGDVVVVSAGTKTPIPSIHNPAEFRKQILQILDKPAQS